MSPREVPRIKRAMLFASSILYCCVVTASPVEAATITVRPDGTGDYPTIQAAINAANTGDEVVLEPGTYAGNGNRNLDFKAKAITVRSLNPDDNTCMRETIIDAEGKGVIVRFVNDEGPKTVFEGFSLGAGDTSTGVRGVPGFFEFSKNARPTTRRLRNKQPQTAAEVVTSSDGQPISTLVDSPGWIPPDGRVWNGFNPFHQPANTTDYYGSGDVDNDGNLTSADLSLAQDMADGITPPVARADVDGDEDVDNDDVSLISSALSGAPIAGWWNSLASVTERNNWIDKFMVIDKTDEHWYHLNYFVCHHFAYQTFVHCAFLRGDFATESTEYDGGQTVFNVPLYFATVSSPTGHAINAILVGDNPLDFDDWRFIEPQNDTDVVPGQWNMLYGSDVYMTAPNLYWNAEVMVRFNVDESGWTLKSYSNNLVLTRPVPPEQHPDNRPDLWNPRIVSVGGSDLILFEKMRDDMSRTTDIHMADLPFDDPSTSTPLIIDSQFSRLLDVTESPDGAVHLLWEGKDVFYRQCIYHGLLNPASGTISDKTNVTGDLRLPSTGRVVVRPDNEVHVFWFENLGMAGAYDFGIHWSKWTGSGWQTPQKLTADAPQGADADWVNRHFARYVFDTAVLDNGDIMVVWDEEVFPTHYISQLIYDGTWNSSRIEDTGWSNSLRGVDLCKDSNGIMHLAYWRGDRQQPGGSEEGRGDLYHRTYDGASWSSPETIDDSGGVCCPRMTATAEGQVHLVWERKVGDHVVPVWNKYQDGRWQTAEELTVPPDANAWYPTAGPLDDGRIVFAWSSRSADLVTIETQTVTPAFDGLDDDEDVDMADFAILASAWMTEYGDANWNPVCDIHYPKDDIINWLDVGVLCENWLTGINLSRSYYFSLDIDPGWSTDGEWAWGQPTGGGGSSHGNPDPDNGYTGTNVYGVNLNGDYSTSAGGPYYLMAGPFDFSFTKNVKVRFARWLNTDYPPYVSSKIEVSNDGSLWNTVWEHTGWSEIVDNDWQIMEYDISSTADDQETVYIRWSYEVTSGAWAYSGWNIDDVELFGGP